MHVTSPEVCFAFVNLPPAPKQIAFADGSDAVAVPEMRGAMINRGVELNCPQRLAMMELAGAALVSMTENPLGTVDC